MRDDCPPFSFLFFVFPVVSCIVPSLWVAKPAAGLLFDPGCCWIWLFDGCMHFVGPCVYKADPGADSVLGPDFVYIHLSFFATDPFVSPRFQWERIGDKLVKQWSK